MPRPPRRRLKFDEDSVNKLLQEIYDDSHNIKAKITRLFIKWEQKAKEEGQIAALGDQIVKLLLAEGKNQDQKIILLRYLKEVVFDNKNVSEIKLSKNDETDKLDSDRRNELISLVQSEFEKKEKEKNK